jgi:hypothetical protein
MFSEVGEIERMQSSLKLNAEGIVQHPRKEAFHPRESEALIDLNPSASRFRIQIDCEPEITSLIGNWVHEAVKPGDIFVGDWMRAEKKEQPFQICEGDVVFAVLDTLPSNQPPPAKPFRLGNFHALAFEVSQASNKLLADLGLSVDEMHIDFSVDVVLPVSTDPRRLSPIEGKPGGKALIAIVPPTATSDPEFEVVSVPADTTEPFRIARTGPGVPRIVENTFLDVGSQWLSIHRFSQHRVVQFYSVVEFNDMKDSPSLESYPPVGVRLDQPDGESCLLVPWEDGSEGHLRFENDELATKLEPKGPPGLRLDLLGAFPGPQGALRYVLEEGVDVDAVKGLVGGWLEEGCQKVQINYGTMGEVTLYREFHISDMEVERRLLAVKGPLPRKVRWSLIREIMGVDPGTPHHTVGITKKQVRRVMKRIRGKR